MKNSIMRDARLRGNFNQWLNKQSVQRLNPPGLDLNRSKQGVNATAGWKNQQMRPRQGAGNMYQNFFRNRSNEQASLPRPAQPATAHAPNTMRRM